MKLIEREKEDFWSKPISIELTVEEFAILISCLWVTHPDDVVNMSRAHLGSEVTNSKLSKKCITWQMKEQNCSRSCKNSKA